MRPSILFLSVCTLLIVLNAVSILASRHFYSTQEKDLQLSLVVSAFHLTDPCISTEARYTRHPSISDEIVPVMDHPGAIEHFPTGSFWTPPQKWSN